MRTVNKTPKPGKRVAARTGWTYACWMQDSKNDIEEIIGNCYHTKKELVGEAECCLYHDPSCPVVRVRITAAPSSFIKEVREFLRHLMHEDNYTVMNSDKREARRLLNRGVA